jgi:hypothetical protein
MEKGFLAYLLGRLRKSTRKKKEMQHSNEAMQNEEVIV